ncbi:MAG: hypothetical protein MJ058_04105 [Akkermansia sp.]|nr:hypothetical protein [Akkermansia sp.]
MAGKIVQTAAQGVDAGLNTAASIMTIRSRQKTARKNAQRADEAAADTVRTAESTGMRALMEAGFRQGEQEIAAGASGFSVSSASYRDVMRGAREVSMMDLDTIRYNAAQKAAKLEQQAEDFRSQARRENWNLAMTIFSGINTQVGLVAGAIAGSKTPTETQVSNKTNDKFVTQVEG